jgi:hypothetical protein
MGISMSKFSYFGVSYGDATHDNECMAVRVQEAYNKNGRFIVIRTYLPASDGNPRRYLAGHAIRPELIPGVITALQKAQRHSEELKQAELAAFSPPAANDDGGCHG